MSRLCLFWETSGGSRGGAWGPRSPPLLLDQNEARRAGKTFFVAHLPPPPPAPLCEGLDPPLETHLFWIDPSIHRLSPMGKKRFNSRRNACFTSVAQLGFKNVVPLPCLSHILFDQIELSAAVAGRLKQALFHFCC